MRKTVAQLERELANANQYRQMYLDMKRKYEDRFEAEYEFLLKQNKILFDSHREMREIIGWLINKDTVFTRDIDNGRERNNIL